MALSAYEEFYNNFKAANTFDARRLAGKGGGIPFEELAEAFKEAASLATTDEFRQMVTAFQAGKLWDYHQDQTSPMYLLARNALKDGALASFKQGSTEKLTLVMTEYSSTFGLPAVVLFNAMNQSDDAKAVLQDALQAGVAGADKQKFLDTSLSYAVSQNAPVVMKAFLDAGANANQKSHNGFPGQLIWSALVYNAPPSTMKLLYDHGASFDDAIFMIKAQGGEKDSIEKLYLYREKVTGEPAPATEVNEKMQALLAEMLEMKREITTLKKEVARLSRAAPAKKKAANAP